MLQIRNLYKRVFDVYCFRFNSKLKYFKQFLPFFLSFECQEESYLKLRKLLKKNHPRLRLVIMVLHLNRKFEIWLCTRALRNTFSEIRNLFGERTTNANTDLGQLIKLMWANIIFRSSLCLNFSSIHFDQKLWTIYCHNHPKKCKRFWTLR